MIIIRDIIQGSAEWLRMRAGVLTASNANRLLTPSKLQLSQQRDGLVDQLVAERLLGEPIDDFQGTFWTERGQQLEGEAGDYFALQTGLDPSPVGFVFRDETRRCGCSPDWMVLDGDTPVCGVEVKCPKASTHIGYLRAGEALKYDPQVQFSIWVTGLQCWWFMSYYPGLPPVLRKIEPDAKWQVALTEHVPALIREVGDVMSEISLAPAWRACRP